MKQITALLLALALLMLPAGCAAPADPSQSAGSIPKDKSLSELVDAIYEKHPMELSLATVAVDLTDPYAVKAYLGLDNAEKVADAVASESMFGAQAYSLVLCKVKDPADAATVAQQMRDGIDQRKWVCAYADDLRVCVCNDVIMLIMIDSQYADSATAQSLTDAFAQVTGGLSLQIQ